MRASTSIPQFFAGAGLLWRGVRVWGTRPGLMFMGLIPGLIALAIVVVGFVALLSNLTALSGFVAGLIAEPGSTWHGAVQVAAGLGIIAGSLLLTVYTFTALTLLIGAPFFEKISGQVDESLGHTPFEVKERRLTSFLRSLRESLLRLLLSALIALGLFLINLVPLVGTVTAFTLGMLIGGWFIASEVTQYPLERRGYTSLKRRRQLLRAERPTALGFGAMAFVLFLIPGGAVLSMPAVISGGTLLARRLAHESTSPTSSDGPPVA